MQNRLIHVGALRRVHVRAPCPVQVWMSALYRARPSGEYRRWTQQHNTGRHVVTSTSTGLLAISNNTFSVSQGTGTNLLKVF